MWARTPRSPRFVPFATGIYSCPVQQKRRSGSPEDGIAVEVYEEFAHLVRFLTSGARAHESGLSLAQHSLLAYISRNPGCLATDISEVFGVHRSTVSRQLRHAIDEGWVEAQQGPARAGHPLRLTEYGARTLDAVSTARLDDVRTGLTGWSREDLDRFTNLLRRFRQGVDPDVRTFDQNDGDSSA